MRLRDKINQVVVDKFSTDPTIINPTATINKVFLSKSGDTVGILPQVGRVKLVSLGVWEVVCAD